ncbi:MAG: translocation/assembly module TamB domain-containing protein [Pseudomonadota bacterium]
MTRLRKSLLAFALLLVFVMAGITWVVATESGLRWVVNRASGSLPEALELGGTRGSLLRGVHVASVEWQNESTRVLIGPTFVHFDLLPLIDRHLLIRELDVASADVTLTATGESDDSAELPEVSLPIDIEVLSASLRQIQIVSGDFNRKIDAIALAASMRQSDLRLSKLLLNSEWLDIDAHGKIRLTDYYDNDVEADWRWKDSETGPFAGELALSGNLRELTLDHSLKLPVAIRSSGTIAIDAGAVAGDLLHEWQDLAWPLDSYTLESSQGTLRTRGSVEALTIDLDAVTPQARIEADGDVRWPSAQSFSLNYRITDVDPGLLLESIKGDIGLAGSVAGTVKAGTPDLEIKVDSIDGNVNGYPVLGSGELQILGPELTLTDTRLQIGSNIIRVAGGLGEILSLESEFSIASIGEITPDAAGAIRGELSVRGHRERPDLVIDMTGARLAWQQYSVGTVSAKADLSANEQGSGELQLGQVVIDDIELAAANLSVTGELAAHSLRATVQGFDSTLDVAATGGYDAQAWSGVIDSLTIQNAVLKRWAFSGASALSASSDQLSLAEMCLSGPRGTDEACIAGKYIANGASTFNASVSGVPLSAIPMVPPEGLTLYGEIYANVNGQWSGQRLNAQSSIEVREASVDAVYDGETVSLAIPVATGQISVVDNRAESAIRIALTDNTAHATVDVSVEDFTNNQSAIAGNVEVMVSDASYVAALVPGIRNPRGSVDGRLTIAGSPGAPEFVGEIVLADGSFGVRQAGIEVSDLNVRLTQLAPGQLRLHGSARSGEGQIVVEGRTEIAAETGIRSEIQLTGENFELVRLPDWRVAASPAVNVVLDDSTATVTGEIKIPTADISVSEIPETAQSPSPDAVVHREEAAPSQVRRIDIDVRAELGDAVQFSGFGLTTGLEGAIQLKGGSQTVYTGQGRLALRDGRYKSYGQELEIERGELIFNGPLESPRLNVRAVRRVDTVVAGIELTGMPTQLQSTVFSEPTMSDAEVLSYLLTGRPLTSATSSGDGDTLNNAAFALGLSSAGSITSQVRTQLGLETLTIEGGVDDSRLIAGKRIGDRLLVEYGYGLIDKLGTLLLRYQLNDRLVLESRTGTVSNLDILYHVKKK